MREAGSEPGSYLVVSGRYLSAEVSSRQRPRTSLPAIRTTSVMRRLLLTVLVAVAACPGLAAAQTLETGRLVEGVACSVDAEQTYTVFLPDHYDRASKWPVLLIMDPRGRSRLAAELFQEAAADLGWILVSSDGTRSDTSMEPNRRAINALWREIHDRYAIDPRRVYMAGFSGTVFVAFMVGRETGAVAGIIGAGGRFLEDAVEGNRSVVFGTAGNTDFNYLDMRDLHAYLDEQGVPNRLQIFDGEHTWMPAEMARRSIQWMELQAIRSGLRAADGALVDRLYQDDLEAARRLETEGRPLEAMRRYLSVATDFEGLRNVEDAARRAAALDQDPQVVSALRQEQRWDDFERRYVKRMSDAIGVLVRSDTAPPPGRFARELEIDRLKRRAEKDGVEGVTARRVLAHVFSVTSFYLMRDLFAQGRPGHAAASLEVACEIEPGNSIVWYNRACALALEGRRDMALDALERAVVTGFSDASLLASDSDLDSLRDTDRFRGLLAAALEASGGAANGAGDGG